MRFLRRLENTLGRFAVPQVTVAIIAVQVLAYGLIVSKPNPQAEAAVLERLLLYPEKVLEGEVWRLATFVAVPPVVGKSMLGPIWAFIAWYVLYLMGTSLEQFWGTLRYNLFLLVWYVATAGVAFLTPSLPTSNVFLEASVLLAFAALFPEFTFLLFVILPVKVKWLALFTCAILALTFAGGDWAVRLAVVASVLNVLLFFWRDILDRIQTSRRRMSRQVAHVTATKEPAFRHRCSVCGITEKTHPNEDFRYCSKCGGHLAYCSQHLRNHEHVTASQEA